MARPPAVVTMRACKGRTPCRKPGAGVSDQEVGQDSGELPEDEEHQKVIRGHQAEHGTGEGQQLSAEPAQIGVFVLEIPGAVNQHQRSDAQDQKGHHPRQGIHPEGQLDVEAGYPRKQLFYATAGIYGLVLEDQPEESCCRDSGKHVESVPAELPEDQGRHSCRYKGDGENCDHCFLRKVRKALSKVGARGYSLGSVSLVYQGTPTVLPLPAYRFAAPPSA